MNRAIIIRNSMLDRLHMFEEFFCEVMLGIPAPREGAVFRIGVAASSLLTSHLLASPVIFEVLRRGVFLRLPSTVLQRNHGKQGFAILLTQKRN